MKLRKPNYNEIPNLLKGLFLKNLYIVCSIFIFIGCQSNNTNISNTPNNTNINNTNELNNTNTNNTHNTTSTQTLSPDKITDIVPIFIIGDSTVHNTTKVNNKRVNWGWGDVIDTLMKNPNLVHNHARSGASSLSFYTDIPSWNTTHFWGKKDDNNTWIRTKNNTMGTAEDIENTDTSSGAFLFIQFGHNDAANGRTLDYATNTVPLVNIKQLNNVPSKLKSYEENLRHYIDFALAHNVTPVLVTPVSRMIPGDCPPDDKTAAACGAQHIYYLHSSSGYYNQNPFNEMTLNYPQAMKKLRQEYLKKGKNVLLLDLTKASMDHYKNINDPQEEKATNKSVQDLYSYNGDQTHFNKTGALKISNIIKQLACHSTLTNASGLCLQFKE